MIRTPRSARAALAAGAALCVPWAAPAAAASDRIPTGPPPATGPAPVLSPALPGPHTPLEADYDLGDQAFVPPSLEMPVDLTGVVYYPADLGGGPYPVIMLLHGMHQMCTFPTEVEPGTDFGFEFFDPWPCRTDLGARAIPSDHGYAYLGRHLASRGFVVVSVSANGVNAWDFGDDAGMEARAELVHRHFELWWEWTHGTAFPGGVDFTGAIDWSRIGTMGHSRGGEGVVYHALLERRLGSRFQPDAVLPLAPVDFFRKQIPGVELGVILPACDGDVFDLQGVHFFDDIRYLHEPESHDRFVMTIDGANHNFFNSVWSPSSGWEGAVDDAQFLLGSYGGPPPEKDPCAPGATGRLDEDTQRFAALLYMTAFFEGSLRDDASLDLWRSTLSEPGRPFLAQSTWQPPSGVRVDLNRYDRSERLTTNDLTGRVEAKALSRRDWCGSADPLVSCLLEPPPSTNGATPPTDTSSIPDVAIAPLLGETHSGVGIEAGVPRLGLGQERVAWVGRSGRVDEHLPDGARDVSGADSLRFRISPNPTAPELLADDPTDLSIRFADTLGNVVQTPASQVGAPALRYPNRRLLLQQIRVPLAPVAAAGVDLTLLEQVSLVFNRTDSGAVDVSDITFADEPRPLATPSPVVEVLARAQPPGPPLPPRPAPPAHPMPGRPRFTG